MTCRVELRLSDETYAGIERWAIESETTKTEIIKRALALYVHASLLNKGAQLMIQEPDGTMKEVVVL